MTGSQARLTLCIAAAVCCAALGFIGPVPGDWHYFTAGSHALFSGRGLHLYVDLPRVQIGPLALLLSRPFDARAGQFVTAVLIAPTIWLTTRAAPRALYPSLFLIPAWTYLAVYGHLDDALAVCLLAAVAADRERPWRCGLWFGLAVACKPVALFAVLMLPGWSAAGVAAAVAGLIAAPFLLAEHATVSAGKPTTYISTNSLLALFGATTVPSWLRAAQLGLACAGGVAGRAWWRVPFLAAAARITIDSQVLPYYTVWLLVGALLVDGKHGRRIPVVTLLAFAVFVVSLAPALGVWWLLPMVGAVVLAVRPGSAEQRSQPSPIQMRSAPTSYV